jgi:hypothetical protein
VAAPFYRVEIFVGSAECCPHQSLKSEAIDGGSIRLIPRIPGPFNKMESITSNYKYQILRLYSGGVTTIAGGVTISAGGNTDEFIEIKWLH